MRGTEPIRRNDRWIRRPTLGVTAGVLLAAAIAGACARETAGASPRESASLALSPCHLDGLAEEVLCGMHEVYENREARTGRTIPIHVSVLPARRRAPDPDPLFVLAGGPGQGARTYAGLVSGAFHDVRRTRDIVLVDLRGTGGSARLACPNPDDAGLVSVAIDMLGAERCLAELDGDPRFYTHREALADLEEVRQALGYARINVWGGSYGTRAALLYARDHPDRVRSVVLDGAVPLDQRFPLSVPRDTQRALDLLLADCEADRACRSRFPHLDRLIDRLLEELEQRPVRVTAPDPRTGRASTAEVRRETFASGLKLFLYSPEWSRQIPWIVSEASAGNYGPFFALAANGSGASVDTMALGMTFAILCSEDLPRIDEDEVDPATRGTFLGRREIDAWRDQCASWPRGRPFDSDEGTDPVPVAALVLSGHLDPVTPPAWGEAMARRFRDSLHVVVPGAAHNTSFTGCVPDLIAEFIERGTAADLETSCAREARRPPFVLGPMDGAP